MNDEPSNKVLADHARVKRKLVPPLKRALGPKLSEYSWTRQLVPEAIWLGLVIEQHGYEAARRICCALVDRTVAAMGDAPLRLVRLSSYASLTEAAKATTREALDEATRSTLIEALSPLRAILPDHPLAFLGESQTPQGGADKLPELLDQFYDRTSRLAVQSMALAYELSIAQGKLHIAEHMAAGLAERFDAIGNYPDDEASRDAAGAFRAAVPMMFLAPGENGLRGDDTWVEGFWDAVSGYGRCVTEDTIVDDVVETDDVLERFVYDVRNAVKADLRSRLDVWPLDLHSIEAYEVVAALMARQATLIAEMASAPGIWTPHSAPVHLRSIADVFISLAWILRDPQSRAAKFVEDGLGAIKLQIAHQERALAAATDDEERALNTQMLEVWKAWLASQRMEGFVEVNLGSWSGLNTRKMAEEAGALDFYNHVYQPFSGAAHSNWAHISMFNAVPCANPAHRNHRSPAIIPIEPDAHWLFLAVKYFNKTLRHFDEATGHTGLPTTAWDLFD